MGSCSGFQPSLPCSDCSSSLSLKPKLLLHQQLNNVLGLFVPIWCYSQTPYLEIVFVGPIAPISQCAACALNSPSTIPSTTKRTVREHQLTQYCPWAACALPMGRLRPPNTLKQPPIHASTQAGGRGFPYLSIPLQNQGARWFSTWGPHSHLGVLHQSTVGPSPPCRVQPAL